jgi:raffinose/stachyose/melibiose transport system substrate-binding protein
MFWRSRRAALGAAAALSLVLAACGGDSDGADDAEGAGDDAPAEHIDEDVIEQTVGEGDTTITWWHISTGDPLLSLWEDLAEEYATENDVTIEITVIENEAFKTAIATAAQAGDMPDLFQSWGGGVLAQQAEAGLTRDISGDIAGWADGLSNAAVAPYTVDDAVYGLAWDMGMVGFWYNRALFAEAGVTEPPETWAQFLDAVRALKDAGITPIAVGAGEEWPAHFYYAYLSMRVAGLDGVRAAAEARSFDSPDFIRAGELLQELVELEPFQDGYLGTGFGGVDGSAGYMARGDTAMELMGQWGPDVMAGAGAEQAALEEGIDIEAEDAEIPPLPEHPLGDDLGFFPFPVVDGGAGAITELMGGGNGIAVSSTAPDEAVDFLAFLFETDKLRRIVGTGAAAPVSADPEDTAGEIAPYMEPLFETLGRATGFQLYFDQDFPPAVGDQVNNSVAQLFGGQASPEEVAQAITTVWQREPN